MHLYKSIFHEQLCVIVLSTLPFVWPIVACSNYSHFLAIIIIKAPAVFSPLHKVLSFFWPVVLFITSTTTST